MLKLSIDSVIAVSPDTVRYRSRIYGTTVHHHGVTDGFAASFERICLHHNTANVTLTFSHHSVYFVQQFN
jgi:hypothetical protein